MLLLHVCKYVKNVIQNDVIILAMINSKIYHPNISNVKQMLTNFCLSTENLCEFTFKIMAYLSRGEVNNKLQDFEKRQLLACLTLSNF